MRPLLASAALLLTIALPAQAQLGGLAKRMKDKAMEKVADKAVDKAAEKTGLNQNPPAYDDVTVELTAARLDGLLKGLAAQKQVLEGNGGIAALVRRNDDLEAQSRTLSDRANAASNGYSNARSRWSTCESDVRDGLNKSHEDEARRATAALMANPAGAADKARKASAAQQEMAKALAANDTLAMKTWSIEYYKAWGIDLSRDEAAIKTKCGAPPAKPAAMLELEKVEAQRDSVQKEIRAVENRAVLEAARVSGLSEQQFAMARERAEMALGASRTRFSKGELAAIDARRADLQAFFRKP